MRSRWDVALIAAFLRSGAAKIVFVIALLALAARGYPRRVACAISCLVLWLCLIDSELVVILRQSDDRGHLADRNFSHLALRSAVEVGGGEFFDVRLGIVLGFLDDRHSITLRDFSAVRRFGVLVVGSVGSPRVCAGSHPAQQQKGVHKRLED